MAGELRAWRQCAQQSRFCLTQIWRRLHADNLAKTESVLTRPAKLDERRQRGDRALRKYPRSAK